MKYQNAADVLPEYLLIEIQKHINGEFLYIPTGKEHRKWGEKNGTKQYFKNRNKMIKQQFHMGYSIIQISQEFGLAYETVRKIVYQA